MNSYKVAASAGFDLGFLFGFVLDVCANVPIIAVHER